MVKLRLRSFVIFPKHKGLIEKLKSYGINGKLLQWLKDYISERKQQVLLNNSISILGTLKAGVPQG